LFGLAVAVALECTGTARARPLKILTSFVPVYSLTANVAGDLASVENLLPGNVDPHDYQFSPRDLSKLQAADVLVINGLGIEDWLLKALKSAKRDHPPVIVELAGGLGASQLIYDADKDHPNPHIWLDPLLAQHGVTNICNALQKADPANATGYAKNTATCIVDLGQLDDQIRTAAAKFTHRDIVTEHNAFAYFARRYGLNIVGVIEQVDEVPPSPRQLARLGDAIRKNGIKAIFTSPPTAGRETRQIAADLNATLATLNTIEIGPLQPSTYEDEMRENLRTLEQYLR
jgi:zinc transport system substrate-binding protein